MRRRLILTVAFSTFLASTGLAQRGGSTEAGREETERASALPSVGAGAAELSQPQVAASPEFRAAGRGGSLLPAGWLSTRGSRIIDEEGNVVRIASIGWYGTDRVRSRQ
jgi:hypothetical protein